MHKPHTQTKRGEERAQVGMRTCAREGHFHLQPWLTKLKIADGIVTLESEYVMGPKLNDFEGDAGATELFCDCMHVGVG